MVPAAGIAATADEAVADDGDLDLYVTPGSDAFTAGSVSEGDWSTDGSSVIGKTTPSAPLEKTYSAGHTQAYIPTQVKLSDGSTTVDVTTDEYQVVFQKAGADGKPDGADIAAPTAVGTYFAVVKAVSGPYQGGAASIEFSITAADLANPGTDRSTAVYNVTAYSNLAAGDASGSIDSFTYDGAAQEIGVFIDDTSANRVDKVLAAGTDYTIKYYNAADDYNDPAKGSSTPPTNAGSYFARITGTGSYSGSVSVDFTVGALELQSDPDHPTAEGYVVIDDVIGTNATMPTAPSAVVVNGEKTTALNSQIKLTYWKWTDVGSANLGKWNASTSGTDSPASGDYWAKMDVAGGALGDDATYYVSAAPASGENKNISQTPAGLFKVTKAAKLANAYYGSEALPSTWSTNTSTLSTTPAFDLDQISVYNGDKSTGGKKLTKGTDYEVTVLKDDGSTASLTDYNDGAVGTAIVKPGVWTVQVKVLPGSMNNSDYAVGGTFTTTVTVTDGTVDANTNVFVKYNGDLVTSVTRAYNPDDALTFAVNGGTSDANTVDVTATVPTGSTESVDLSLELYDSKGEKLIRNSVTDAGSYTLKIKSSNYTLTGTTEVPVTITPMDLQDITLATSVTMPSESNTVAVEYKSGDGVYIDSSSAVTLASGTTTATPIVYLATDSDGDGVLDQYTNIPNTVTATWYVYDNDKGEYVASSKIEAGYEGKAKVVLSASDPSEAGNYVFSGGAEFVVTPYAQVFDDVLPSDWFYGTVSAAQKAKIANGWTVGTAPSQTALFNPYGALNRADFVCFLYNLAGGDANESEGFNPIPDGGTPGDSTYKSFSDVADDAYYSEAVAWAKYTGVANGYGDGTFAPTAPLTREQAAAFIANYAQKVAGLDTSVADPEAAIAAKSDPDSVSEWAVGTVAWMVENGIMGNGGFINGQGVGNRAEGVTMIMNFKDKFDL